MYKETQYLFGEKNNITSVLLASISKYIALLTLDRHCLSVS